MIAGHLDEIVQVIALKRTTERQVEMLRESTAF
jgi:hypothetical protein